MRRSQSPLGKIVQEIPIKSFCVAAFVCRGNREDHEYLIIKRSSDYLKETWQMVSGKIERKEFAWQAALREIHEETGLVPDRLYSADRVEIFYEANQDCINMIPVFLALVPEHAVVKLNPMEHSDYAWLRVQDAIDRLAFSLQKDNLRHIEEQFWGNSPIQHLEIKMGRQP